MRFLKYKHLRLLGFVFKLTVIVFLGGGGFWKLLLDVKIDGKIPFNKPWNIGLETEPESSSLSGNTFV